MYAQVDKLIGNKLMSPSSKTHQQGNMLNPYKKEDLPNALKRTVSAPLALVQRLQEKVLTFETSNQRQINVISEVPKVDEAPYSSGGALYFKIPGNDSLFTGSAQYCEHPKVLITAVHNLYDRETKQYCKDIQFYQQKGGTNVAGYQKNVQRIFVPQQYIDAAEDDPTHTGFDYGFIITKEVSEYGAYLHYANSEVGSYGKWIGYPENSAKMKSGDFHIEHDVQIPNILFSTGDVAAQGASGGAWILKGSNPNDHITTTIMGLVATGVDNIFFSPRFNELTKKYLESVISIATP